MSAPTLTGRSTRLPTRAAAVAGATLVAVVVWLVSVPLLGYDLAVERWDGDGAMTVTPGQVVVTALVASLAAWAALAVLERQTSRARTVWLAGATSILVASLGMPLTAAASTAAAVILALMHVVVGAVLIPTLARSVR